MSNATQSDLNNLTWVTTFHLN